MITVMGATGHTGKKITEALLKAVEKVCALGRSEIKLAEPKSAGAEVLTGDTIDAAFLTKAFQQCCASLRRNRRSHQAVARLHIIRIDVHGHGRSGIRTPLILEELADDFHASGTRSERK